MTSTSSTRRTFAILLFLVIAGTAWLMLHEALRGVSTASHRDVALDPGYQHSQRLKIATARAAMDALAIAGTNSNAGYQADYHLQKMQIQADSEGLERWATHDPQRQGLLMEIRASLAGLRVALDQTTGSPMASSPLTANTPHIALLPALNRAETALSNYAASLTEPMDLQQTHYLFAGPVRLWWLLVLLLLELAALAWLVLPARANSSSL